MIKIEIDNFVNYHELKATSKFIDTIANLRLEREKEFEKLNIDPMDIGTTKDAREDEAVECEMLNKYPGKVTPVDKLVLTEASKMFPVEHETEVPAPPKRKTNYLHTAPYSVVPPAEHEMDSRGFAWNPEIHSETKAKNKDGTWRYRRGVDKTLIVELEEASMPHSEPKQLEITERVHELDVPNPPTMGTVRAGAPVASIMTFMDLMKKITQAKVSGRITQERIQEISFQVIGDKNLSKLSTQQDKIPEVSAIIDAELLM